MHSAHVPQANLNSPKIRGVGFMMGFLIVFRGELKTDSTKTLYTLLRLGYFVSLPYKFSIQMPCVEHGLGCLSRWPSHFTKDWLNGVIGVYVLTVVILGLDDNWLENPAVRKVGVIFIEVNS